MTISESSIYIDGHIIPRVKDEDNHFLNRLTILYGPSGSGKSSIITHIMNTLKDYIPVCIVCSPTALMNGDYSNIIPDVAIHSDVTENLLTNIFDRQENMLKMYHLVRDLDKLRPLFRVIANHSELERIETLSRILHQGYLHIKKHCDADDYDIKKAELEDTFTRKALRCMRNAINANIKKLLEMDISDIERSMLLNFNINPNILLIIDDCAASVKSWRDLEVTKALFFQGRHYKITVLLTMQNEAIITPPLRQNAHISVFTTEKIVNTFCRKQSSGLSNEDIKKMAKIASSLFLPSDNKTKPNYKKLVMFSQLISTEFKIQFMIANPKKRKFGSDPYWQLCKDLKKDNEINANTNKFNKMFNLKSAPKLIG